MASGRFNIRRVHDDILPKNQERIQKCGDILVSQIPTCSEREKNRLLHCLRDPIAFGFRSVLLVAERQSSLIGFAVLMHNPKAGFTYLDFLCAAPGKTSGGIGGILYQRCREESLALKVCGLFFEVWSDDPELLLPQDKDKLEQNVARLRFYERFGARPIIGTRWDRPSHQKDIPVTHLCYDGLSADNPLKLTQGKAVVRAILEQKYADTVDQATIDNVVESMGDDPVKLREPRYIKKRVALPKIDYFHDPQIVMVVNEDHEKHEVHDRGYHETPVRINAIKEALSGGNLVRQIESRKWNDKYITVVHTPDYHRFLQEISVAVGEKSIYPDVFPLRNHHRQPKNPIHRAGWFCIDTFTPLNALAINAARNAVNCSLTAADEILQGRYRLAYALVRPPGHHAESRVFGGYCYYNNCAIAASYLLEQVPRIAIIDIDYHHGNGQQEIFYRRQDVLTVSIHGDPLVSYPFYTGFVDETGEGSGVGFNLNIPLPEKIDGPAYRRHGLEPAFDKIREFNPTILIVALGLDTAKADPTGTWMLNEKDLFINGQSIGELGLPTLVIQEGGYRIRTLGTNARNFLEGLCNGAKKFE